MRHPIKLFCLVAIATLIAPTIQAPGFSETTQQIRLQQDTFPVLTQTASNSERKAEADRLFDQGNELFSVSQFREALQFWEAALEIYRETDIREAFPEESYQLEGITLGNLGAAYASLGQYQQAIDLYEQQLIIAREIGYRRGEGIALGNLSFAYFQLGQLQRAINYSEQALTIAREIEDRQGEGVAFRNLGLVYSLLGEYSKAIDLHEQSLTISREIGNLEGESSALGNLGIVYQGLGQYLEAIDLYEQQLFIVREIDDRQGEANALGNLGLAYLSVGQTQQAIDFYEQVLTITREIGDRQGEGTTLANLGLSYLNLAQYSQAIDFYEQALTITREIGDRQGQGLTLGNLGIIYSILDQYSKAIDFYEQSLEIVREVGDRATEGLILGSLGKLLNDQGKQELAVIFLKASVEVRESIRGYIAGLDTELKQSFTDTIADDYRFLADLLLQQNRILEAQRVLDLLKVQELNESLRSVQGSRDTETGVGFWQIEEELLALYEQVTEESTDLAELQAQDYDSLSLEQQQRLTELRQRYETVQNQFIAFLDLPEVQALLEQIEDETDGQNVDIERQHRKLQNRLQDLPQETALLYPLILSDRLELVLVTADGPPLRFPIAVAGADLNRKIVAFGQALKSPGSDIQPLAQELYMLLFAELEATLDQAGIESIIYAPDGALRYVPLAALHDGEQYLADRFSISHIVAASLTDFALPPDKDQRQLLAAACAECSFTITVGDREFPFGDLPYTEAEVTSLAEQMPDTTVLLNQDFSLKELENRLNNYSILHLATHGAVVENAPAQSFVVLGSGEQVSLETIRNSWSLDAELVVLSACETAVGSEELGSGVEILGLGYQMQEAGAQAVLASLWKVSDPGTQALMSAFYEALAQGMTKGEALQAAQRAMIDGSSTVSDADDPRAGARPVSRDGAAINGNHPGYSHPYYWAPFILIGNGL